MVVSKCFIFDFHVRFKIFVPIPCNLYQLDQLFSIIIYFRKLLPENGNTSTRWGHNRGLLVLVYILVFVWFFLWIFVLILVVVLFSVLGCGSFLLFWLWFFFLFWLWLFFASFRGSSFLFFLWLLFFVLVPLLTVFKW